MFEKKRGSEVLSIYECHLSLGNYKTNTKLTAKVGTVKKKKSSLLLLFSFRSSVKVNT